MDYIDLDKLIQEHEKRIPPLENTFLAPQNPFFWLICASTGGGKTYSLIQLLLGQHLKFDHLYLFIKDIQEDKWQFYLSFLKTIEDDHFAKTGEEIRLFTVGTGKEDIPEVDKLDTEITRLFVFDDFMSDKVANESVISDLFTRGRRKNCSIVYMTQYFYAVPKTIRANCNYYSLFSVNRRDLSELSKEFAMDMDSNQFRELFRECTKQKHGFLFIDKKTTEPALKYRCGFDKLLTRPL